MGGMSQTPTSYQPYTPGRPGPEDRRDRYVGRHHAQPCSSDGLAVASSLAPRKSNWARAIAEPPFLAWPIVGAIAYTFGGLATDARARVLRDGQPIPGLYAAGEITGHFYGTAPNAVSVLRAFAFGRIAGRETIAALSPAAL